MTSSEQYEDLLEFAYGLAEKASDMILKGSAERWSKAADTTEKKNAVDLVTKTDQAVEEMIKASIKKAYPSHKFIGEESFEAGERDGLTDDFTWIVDPIDGTMNFVHSHPAVGCSIGLTHKSRPVVGVIALPFYNQIFSAREGGGAFMNRTIPLPLTGGIPQPLTELSQCLTTAEWGSDRSLKTITPKLNSFSKLAGDPAKGVQGGVLAHALRTTGASTVNIAAVIAGQLDIYWDNGPWAWDVCAGIIILQETGGFFSGSKEDFEKDTPVGEMIMNRRYIFVRAVPDSQTETGLEIQRRLVKELYDVVEPWTSSTMV
ncbi:myo-inositol-1(or 4)-monophosphatase, partial [Tremellales sp. Uapishka_1]